jgi:energy-coupling factor transporter ATP-binding protein EcfA2
MLSANRGRPIAKVKGGEFSGNIIHVVDPHSKCCKHCGKKCYRNPCCEECSQMDESLTKEINVGSGKVISLPNLKERDVIYIAGPSGSGKTTQARELINLYQKFYPEKEFYIFSRTDAKNDPAMAGVRGFQIDVDERLIDEPIDIENDFAGGSIILFDDCNTIQNDKLKKVIDGLMADIMEVGRKLDITIIITNHLVIPNERKVARTIMNEMKTLTIFPQSGSAQQITYVLKQYFGLSKNQIQKILALPSRWVTIHKSFPQCVLHEKGAYIL